MLNPNRPKKERTARPSGAAPEADEEPLLDFSGTDPATFDVYDKRSKEEKESGDALALEKAGALMVFKRCVCVGGGGVGGVVCSKPN